MIQCSKVVPVFGVSHMQRIGVIALIGLLYTLTGQTPTLGQAYIERELYPLSHHNNGLFGWSVAIDDDWIVAGSPTAYADDRGLANVWYRTPTGYSLMFWYPGQSEGDQARHGYSVGVSGNTIIMGAPQDDGDLGADQGSVEIWRLDPTPSESLEAQLVGATAFDHFGDSVAISGDTAIVGAPDWDGPGRPNQGTAYVYTRTGSAWSLQAQLLSPFPQSNDYFGKAVDIDTSTATPRALIGAPYDDGASVDRGFAYLFERAGATWSFAATWSASFAATGDQFGTSVALRGNRAIVGSPYDDSACVDCGAAYVFALNGATWSEEAILLAPDAAQGDQFGASVDLRSTRAVVGAPYDDGPDATDQGSVHIFERLLDGTTWYGTHHFASNAGTDDRFGRSVAISGSSAVAGAPTHDGSAGPNQGSAFSLTPECVFPSQGCTSVFYIVSTSGGTIPAPPFNLVRTTTVADHQIVQNVSLVLRNLSHFNYGVLTITLAHGGVEVDLMRPFTPPDDSNLIGQYWLSDAAVVSLDAAAADAGATIPPGVYSGDESLAAFRGMDAQGTWTLLLQNSVDPGFASSLADWDLFLYAQPVGACDTCLSCSPGCVAGNEFGNANCFGAVTIDDILCVLAGFASMTNCPHGDIAPCLGNNNINLDDILAVLAAFGGTDPCGC